MRKYEVMELRLGNETEDLYAYVVVNTEVGKVVVSSVYDVEDAPEAHHYRAQLEQADLLKAHWPDSRDPEVAAVLSDPDFAPDIVGQSFEEEIQRINRASEVVARRRAGLDG